MVGGVVQGASLSEKEWKWEVSVGDNEGQLGIGLRRANQQIVAQLTLVLLDKQKFKQILYNLLGNAIKFTHVGEVILKVRGEEHETNISYLFSIKDTGIGISAADLSRIFLEFEQARDKDQSRKGTGLGLAISKQLIERTMRIRVLASDA